MEALADLILYLHDHRPFVYASVTVLSMVVLGTASALIAGWFAARSRRTSQLPDVTDLGD
jgi:hypothetical protein